MAYEIYKKFTFEAAHRLIKNYQGKCTNNHGHSWEVIVYIQSEMLDPRDMVIDFSETKILKTWIDDNLDHSTILWDKDPMCQYIRESGQRIFLTSDNPTSEYIARLIFDKACELFQSNSINVACVEVKETCTSGVKYYSPK